MSVIYLPLLYVMHHACYYYFEHAVADLGGDPTLLKMWCSITPLGSPTSTVINKIKGIL